MINRDDAFRASIAAAAASDDARDGDAEKVERMAGSILRMMNSDVRYTQRLPTMLEINLIATAALTALREMEGE